MNDQQAMMPVDEFEEWVFDNEIIIMEYINTIPHNDMMCILLYMIEMWQRFELDPYNDPVMYADSIDWAEETELHDYMNEPLEQYVMQMIDDINHYKKVNRIHNLTKGKVKL